MVLRPGIVTMSDRDRIEVLESGGNGPFPVGKASCKSGRAAYNAIVAGIARPRGAGAGPTPHAGESGPKQEKRGGRLMGLRFIFMLTRDDRTVENAADCLATALSLGIRHIGFKDVGLAVEDLKRLNTTIKQSGATSYLEVVSLGRESEVMSARAAVDIGVDFLLGGIRVDDVLPVLDGTGIRYYPFPGRIAGHPSVLEGTVEEIVASARALAARAGVHGLDLLAYRAPLPDVPGLIAAVCEAAGKPVIVAGSIADKDRIAVVRQAGAIGFTIGTAALDGAYPADDGGLEGQLSAIVRDVANLNGHL